MILAIDPSAFDLFYAGLAAVVVVSVVAAAYVRYRRVETPEVPEGWGAAPDDRLWQSEARELPHKALADVRGVAKSWGETVGTFLGVFTIAAFIKGPDTFTDVSGGEAEAAALLILLAAVVAAAAVFLSAMAAQGVPRSLENLDGWSLRHHTIARTNEAIGQLAVSRGLALLALVLILTSIGLTWFASLEERDEAGGKTQKAVLIPSGGGQAVCGELKSAGGRLSIVVAGGQRPEPISGGQVVPVEECP